MAPRALIGRTRPGSATRTGSGPDSRPRPAASTQYAPGWCCFAPRSLIGQARPVERSPSGESRSIQPGDCGAGHREGKIGATPDGPWPASTTPERVEGKRFRQTLALTIPRASRGRHGPPYLTTCESSGCRVSRPTCRFWSSGRARLDPRSSAAPAISFASSAVEGRLPAARQDRRLRTWLN